MAPQCPHQVLAQSDLPWGSWWGLKIFKMATFGAILDIGTFLQFWISMSLRYLLSSLGWIRITIREMSFEEFQDGLCGSHLECRNRTNLAVMNLHVSPIPLTKFQLNSTYRLGADVMSSFSSCSPWRSSWILERNEFGNSKSPRLPNASHQVWTQSDLPFGSRRGLKIFKMATVAAILDSGTERF